MIIRGAVRKIALGTVLVTLAGIPAALQALPEKERTISFFHIHTKETLTLTYKRNGRHLPDAMKSINWFMRDWRQNTVVKMDPRAIDILWEMHSELGSKEPIHIICGYRSRKTNNMLRRKRGGQASNSLHLYGKAIDAHFPDVPVRYVRYAALVRERGGVGYYPTSALPFVHVDTGRVRHWPRMKRDELALLFSNGRSKHVPHGGRRLRPSDVKRAQSRQKNLATQVAAYHALRAGPIRPAVFADSGIIKPPKPEPAMRPPGLTKPTAVALAQVPDSLTGKTTSAAAEKNNEWTVEVAPNMRLALASPKPTPAFEDSVKFRPGLSDTDRTRLNRLIADVTFTPLDQAPKLLHSTEPARNGEVRERILQQTPRTAVGPPPQPTLVSPPAPAHQSETRFGWAPDMVAVLDDRAWTSAPEYDDDHPDEMAYRPFPIEPLMTSEPNDPALIQLTRPDNKRTLDMLFDADRIPPMQLRPSQQLAQLMWRQEFSGAAVQMRAKDEVEDRSALSARRVATSSE